MTRRETDNDPKVVVEKWELVVGDGGEEWKHSGDARPDRNNSPSQACPERPRALSSQP